MPTMRPKKRGSIMKVRQLAPATASAISADVDDARVFFNDDPVTAVIEDLHHYGSEDEDHDRSGDHSLDTSRHVASILRDNGREIEPIPEQDEMERGSEESGEEIRVTRSPDDGEDPDTPLKSVEPRRDPYDIPESGQEVEIDIEERLRQADEVLRADEVDVKDEDYEVVEFEAQAEDYEQAELDDEALQMDLREQQEPEENAHQYANADPDGDYQYQSEPEDEYEEEPDQHAQPHVETGSHGAPASGIPYQAQTEDDGRAGIEPAQPPMASSTWRDPEEPAQPPPSSNLRQSQIPSSWRRTQNDQETGVSLAFVQTDKLSLMFKTLGGSHWTGIGQYWYKDFMTKEKDKNVWFKDHTTDLSESLTKTFRYTHTLLREFQMAPRLSEEEFSDQQRYFAQPDVRYRSDKSTEQVQKGIHHVFTRRGRDGGENMAKGLTTQLIPLLATALKYAFVMGSRVPIDPEKELPAELKADFPEPVLRRLIQITSWIEKLHDFLIRRSETPNIGRHHGILARHLKGLKEHLESGLEALNEEDEEAEGQRIQFLIKKDDQAILDRRNKVRQQRTAQDRQMELFLSSTTRMGRPKGSSYSYKPFPGRQGSTKRASSASDYKKRNHGWTWEEDNVLLGVIRRVREPKMNGLRELLPKHGRAEIIRRIHDLKAKSKLHYTQVKGVVPPEWCA